MELITKTSCGSSASSNAVTDISVLAEIINLDHDYDGQSVVRWWKETCDRDEEVDTPSNIDTPSDVDTSSDVDLKSIYYYVFSYSPSHNIYSRADMEENTTMPVCSSQQSVHVRDDVLSYGTSKHQITNTMNMIEDMCYIQDVRSEEDKNKQTQTEATEFDNVIDCQETIPDVNDRHIDFSEDLNQERCSKFLKKGLSACEKTPQSQQSDSDIVICSIKSLDKILASQKSYKCNFCGLEFKLNISLQKHRQIHMGKILYKCDVCGREFRLLKHFKAHRIIHTGEKPYQCDVCRLKFSLMETLKTHKIIHASENPYKCNVCGSKFACKEGLKTHTQTHTSEKNFMCDVCGHRCKTKVNLKSHSRTHTGEKPYQCDVCGRSFSENSSLTTHKRTHTGERPYKCDVCGFAFTQSSCLLTHKRIHTGEKPYMCDICGFQVNRKDNLKLHKKIHAA